MIMRGFFLPAKSVDTATMPPLYSSRGTKMAINPTLTIARRAAEEAGKILQMGLRQLDQIQIEEKGRGDLVSVVDRRAEEVIKNILLDKYPQHDFLGEESGETRARAEEPQAVWIDAEGDTTTVFARIRPHLEALRQP